MRISARAKLNASRSGFLGYLNRTVAFRAVPRQVRAGGVLPVGFDQLDLYFSKIEAILKRFTDEKERKIISLAFELAWQGHFGEYRKDPGKKIPYIDHPLRVAKIIAFLGFSGNTTAAALLHDVVENCRIDGERVTLDYIRGYYAQAGFTGEGEDIAGLVDGVTTLGKEPGARKRAPSVIDIYKKWLKAGDRDLRVILIKLIDRYDNAITFYNLAPEKRVAKARETLQLHARFLKALGMWFYSREMEDYSYRYTDADVHDQIFLKREELCLASEGAIRAAKNQLAEQLAQSGFPGVEIEIETRHIYELATRMRTWGIKLDDLAASDIYRLNIVVPEGSNCYQAKGAVVKTFRPLEDHRLGEMFMSKDHIAVPMAGHQFLHFYVAGVPGVDQLLIQIRDQAMNDRYRHGVIVDIRGHAAGPEQSAEFIHNLYRELRAAGDVSASALDDVFASHCASIVALTPIGDEITLPFGSSALDFARSIHGQLMMRAAEAKVNGRTVPVTAKLTNGDTVEIIKAEDELASILWLPHLRPLPARQTLRRHLSGFSPEGIRENALLALTEAAEGLSLRAKDLVDSVIFHRYLESYDYPGIDKDEAELQALKKRLPAGQSEQPELNQAIEGMKRSILNKKIACLLKQIGTGEKPADEVVAELKQFYQNRRDEAKKRFKRLAAKLAEAEATGRPEAAHLREYYGAMLTPFWIHVKTGLSIAAGKKKIGYIDTILKDFAALEFSIYDFVRIHEEGKVGFLIAVNVYGGRHQGGVVGSTQRLMVRSLGAKYGAVEVVADRAKLESLLTAKARDVVF